MRKWLLLLGFLLILPACAPEQTRVYVSGAADGWLRTVMDNCSGVTITTREQGSHYTLSITSHYVGADRTNLVVTVSNAKGDVLFTSLADTNLFPLIVSACEAIMENR